MFKIILKGMIIGLANIIPGVSGGTLAISMGIYDKLIHCITHFFSEIKDNILFLAPVILGMGIAIVGSAFGIDYLFATFPIQTNLLFIGLILGGLPAIYGKVRHATIKVGYLICTLLFFAIVVGMALMNGTSGNTVTFDMSLTQIMVLFFIGLIASGTMVVPGVSGSMMLLVLGYYTPILTTIKKFIVSLLRLDFNALPSTLFILVPFGIGVVAGIFIIAKIVEVIFEKFPMYAYWSIIGLLAASPIAILLVGDFPKITVSHVCTGIITFIAGWMIANKLGEKE